MTKTVTVQGQGTPPPSPPAQGESVGIQDFAFNPPTITVPVGTTITWTNLDSAPHTVTSDGGLFDSGTLNQGQTFQFTFNTPGTYSYFCSIHSFMTAQVIVQGASPPPGGGSSSLKDFDTNDNDVIDDPEFFAIIDAWIAGQIGDSLFFQAVDLWVSQSQISSAGLASRPRGSSTVELITQSGSHATTFEVSGLEIASLTVRIYDLKGREVFVQETRGNRLVWYRDTTDGRAVANGVYLYVVTARDLSGAAIRSEVKKLAIMR
jgi:plastocyanin